MATYNGEKFIEEQLDSIRGQTLKVDEVLICDDCSTDDTIHIITNYIRGYQLDNWKVIQNDMNLGHYQTFLNLTLQASGDYVFFSDQDDIWNENKVKIMMGYLQLPNNSMVYCQSNFIDENNNLIKSPKVSDDVVISPLKSLLKKWPSGYQSAYKNTVLQDIVSGKYRIEHAYEFHDVLFGMLASAYGNVVKVDMILDQHRVHSNNVTFSNQSKSLQQSLEERVSYYNKMRQRYSYTYETYKKIGCKHHDSKIIKNYIILYTDRIDFVNNRSLTSLSRSLQRLSYYNGVRGFISDFVYAFRVNNLFTKIRRYLK